MFGKHLHDAGILIEARRIDLVALNETDLFRGAVAACLDRCFRFKLAKTVPVRANEGIGREIRRIVDENDIDALRLRLLEKLAVGVQIGRMDDQNVGMLVGIDQIGDRLGAGFDRPVRITGFKGATPALDLALEIGGPALREIEAHGHGNERHALAGERLRIGGRPGIIIRHCGSGKSKQSGTRRRSTNVSPNHWRLLCNQMSPCWAVCSSRGLSRLSTMMAMSRIVALKRFW